MGTLQRWWEAHLVLDGLIAASGREILRHDEEATARRRFSAASPGSTMGSLMGK